MRLPLSVLMTTTASSPGSQSKALLHKVFDVSYRFHFNACCCLCLLSVLFLDIGQFRIYI